MKTSNLADSPKALRAGSPRSVRSGCVKDQPLGIQKLQDLPKFPVMFDAAGSTRLVSLAKHTKQAQGQFNSRLI